MNVEHVKAGLQFVLAIYETIKEAGPQGAPEGPMYLAVVTRNFTLEAFQNAIELLIDKKLIRRSGHVLFYIPQTHEETRQWYQAQADALARKKAEPAALPPARPAA